MTNTTETTTTDKPAGGTVAVHERKLLMNATTTAQGISIKRGRRQQRILAVLGLSLLGLGMPFVNSAGASTTTKEVDGTKTGQAVTGPSCSSPVGVCGAGVASGPLHGPFEVVATGVAPTSEPDISILTYTAVYHTNRGDLQVSGRGLLNTVTTRYSTVDEIVGGTGHWTGASGSWQEVGTFSVAAGQSSQYHAVITTP